MTIKTALIALVSATNVLIMDDTVQTPAQDAVVWASAALDAADDASVAAFVTAASALIATTDADIASVLKASGALTAYLASMEGLRGHRARNAQSKADAAVRAEKRRSDHETANLMSSMIARADTMARIQAHQARNAALRMKPANDVAAPVQAAAA